MTISEKINSGVFIAAGFLETNFVSYEQLLEKGYCEEVLDDLLGNPDILVVEDDEIFGFFSCTRVMQMEYSLFKTNDYCDDCISA